MLSHQRQQYPINSNPSPYVFPRNLSQNSESSHIQSLEGLLKYKLGNENPKECKLASTPIQMSRNPIIGISKLRQINSTKKTFISNQNDNQKVIENNDLKGNIHQSRSIEGSYYISPIKIPLKKEQIQKSLSTKRKIKLSLQKSENSSKNGVNNVFYNKIKNKHVCPVQQKNYNRKKKKIEVISSAKSLRKIQSYKILIQNKKNKQLLVKKPQQLNEQSVINFQINKKDIVSSFNQPYSLKQFNIQTNTQPNFIRKVINYARPMSSLTQYQYQKVYNSKVIPNTIKYNQMMNFNTYR